MVQGLKMFDEHITKMIKVLIFKSRSQNHYLINYFMAFLSLLILDIFIFLGNDDPSNGVPEWENNYTKCIKYFNYEDPPVFLSESIGWCPTFGKNLCLVGNISAL